MQNFMVLATFFLVEKKGPGKKREERREKKRNNAKYYGHYVAPLAHALRSDQLAMLLTLACTFKLASQ